MRIRALSRRHLLAPVTAMVVALVLLAVITWLYFYDKEPLFRLRNPAYWYDRWQGTDLYQNGILWHGNRHLPEIALTFDDGPAPTTLQVLATLQAAHIHATFFMVGLHIKAHPEIVQQVMADGNEIGCHSYDHQPLTQLDEHHVQQQIWDSRILLGRLNGHFVAFRPPWARWDQPILDACARQHLPLVMYSFASDCFPGKSPEHWAHRWVSHVEDGSIMLVHDTYPLSVQGLPLLIKDLQDEGYHFVTITEMIDHLPKAARPMPAALSTKG